MKKLILICFLLMNVCFAFASNDMQDAKVVNEKYLVGNAISSKEQTLRPSYMCLPAILIFEDGTMCDGVYCINMTDCNAYPEDCDAPDFFFGTCE